MTLTRPHAWLTGAHADVTTIADADTDWTAATLGDLVQLAIHLQTAKGLVRAARAIEAQIEAACATALDGTRGPVEIPGVGTLERKSGTVRKKWDHARVAPLVAARALEQADGEIDRPLPEWVAARIIDAAGIGYWKAGVLRGLGLEPDAYCDAERGRSTVVFRPASNREDAA